MKYQLQQLLTITGLLLLIFTPTSNKINSLFKNKLHTTGLELSRSSFCSVQAYPDPIDLEQPDGNTFKALFKEESNVIYLETLDGYTILMDPQDNFYKYATRGTDGDLFLTGGVVTDVSDRPLGLLPLLSAIKKHIRFKGMKLQSLNEQHKLKNLDHPDDITNAIFPSTGVRKSLLLLIDFPDQAASHTTTEFDNLANQSGYSVNGATGSFKEYYEDVSYGTLTINTDVEGWYTAINNRATYGVQNIQNRNFTVAKALIKEAVDAAEAAGVDFSQYDGDGDGRVDVVEVIHSGRGAEESGNAADIWSHRSALFGAQSPTYDGVIISDYIIQAEKYQSNITNIGVLVHEFGHALGLPDLYDIDGGSSGLGRWCCMAGGTWNNSGKTPAQMSVYCKTQLGWMTPSVLSGTGSVSNMDYSNSINHSYRFNTPVGSEYFLIENRQKIGWDQYIPGSGLCIYHIDETRGNNTDGNRYRVGLEQADGNNHLNNGNNSGDTADPFPGSGNNTAFGCSTNPNTNNYNSGTSNIDISNIAISNNLASFSYDYCNTNCDIQSITVNEGPLNFNGITYDIKIAVGYAFAPATGMLNVTLDGVLQQVAITTSPQIITFSGLAAHGNPVDISAAFSAELSCSKNALNLFTAPFNCNNDDVCNALDITSYIAAGGNNVISCNNIGATVQQNEPRPSNNGDSQNGWYENNLSNTVWFKFTAPSSGSINIDFVSQIDLQMALWEADNCNDILNPSKAMMVAANDDGSSAGGYSPVLANLKCLIPGKVYYVQIDGWSATTGFFTMVINDPQLSCVAAPMVGSGCGNNFTETSTGSGQWIHLTNAAGQIFASVNDKFNNLGMITANFVSSLGAARVNGNNYPLLDRDWHINVANNNAACIRLYLTDAELMALTNQGGASQLSELNLSKITSAACNNFSGVETYVTQSNNMPNFYATSHMIEFNINSFSGFFPRGNTAILPVELTDFTGLAQKDINHLEWITASEYNTDEFVVQKLNNLENSWEEIGRIKANGFSEQTKFYSWNDVNLLPISQYRLKIIDHDGYFEYSDIINIQRKDISMKILRTFPNPASNQLSIEWLSNKNMALKISLINLTGQLMNEHKFRTEKGSNIHQLDVSSLAKGVYFISLQSEETSVLQKIIVK